MALYTILDITDQTIKDKLAVSCDNQPFIATAPMVLIFCADYRRWYDVFAANDPAARQPALGDLFLANADALIAEENERVEEARRAAAVKIDELEDRVKRQMAEFDNFRKRTEKEKAQMFETGAKSVIEKMLPVVDNFERGLAALSEEEKKQPFAEGMNMVYKQLMAELEKLEVKPIETVGCEFNPDLHNAVMQVESEEFESGVIAQELQKGYTYRDTVVRYSMVAVVS